MKLGMMAAGALLALPALATGQGLGDAAKKEKERRQQTQKSGAPARTYTQDEVLALPPIANEGAGTGNASSPGTTTAVGASPAAPSVAPRATEGDSRQREEQFWRGRANVARQRVEKAQAVHQRLSGMSLVPGYVYEDSTGRVVIHSIEQLQGLTARAKADLDEAQKALESLLDEARRASVPPGWLR
jgi:hypothetical protein